MSILSRVKRSIGRRVRTRSTRAAAWTVAVMLLVGLLAWYGWLAYDASRQRTLVFYGEEPVGIAVYAAGDRTSALLTRDFTRETRVRLPRGDYDVRITGRGRLGDWLSVDLDDDETWVSTSLDHLRYAEPFEESTQLIPLELAGRPVALVVAPEGLRLLELSESSEDRDSRRFREPNASTFPTRWKLDLTDASALGLPSGFDWGLTWAWARITQTQAEAAETLPRTAARTVDLDGDETPDIVLSGTCQAWVMAISGETGDLLWFASRGADVLEKTSRSGKEAHSTILGRPELVDDVDGDGVADVVTTMYERNPPASRVETISGATGKVLWSHAIPSESFAGARPNACHWRAMPPESRPGWGGVVQNGEPEPTPDPARTIAWGPVRAAAVALAESVEILNLATGESLDLQEVPLALARLRQWHDLDGDGYDDLVGWMRTEKASTKPVSNPQSGLVAYSPRRTRRLWERHTSFDERTPPDGNAWQDGSFPSNVMLTDLDGDGHVEVVALSVGGIDGEQQVAALDGRSGRERWARRLARNWFSSNVTYAMIGPDIDGDRTRDVFVLNDPFAFEPRAHAISGANGDELWRTDGALRDVLQSRQVIDRPGLTLPIASEVAQCEWWQAGADGWPQLVVRWRQSREQESSRSWLTCLSAGTGAVTHTGQDVDQALTADLNGDGIEELLTLRITDRRNERGTWETLLGAPATRWRRHLGEGLPIADVNSDGCADVLDISKRPRLRAHDGLTGRLLWDSAPLGDEAYEPTHPGHDQDRFEVRNIAREPAVKRRSGVEPSDESKTEQRARHGASGGGEHFADLDGDGAPDLLITKDEFGSESTWLVSGRTGRRQKLRQANVEASETWAVDLDGDARPEWVVLEQADDATELVAWSADFRRRRWARPMFRAFPHDSGQDTPRTFDCDGDGTADFVLPEADPQTRRVAWTAVSGRTGATLWKVEVDAEADAQVTTHLRRLALVSTTFGGVREATLLLCAEVRGSDSAYLSMQAIAAKSGALRRSWRIPPPYSTDSACVVRRRGVDQAVAFVIPLGGHATLVSADGTITLSEFSDADAWMDIDVQAVVLDVDDDGDDDVVMEAPEGIGAWNLFSGERKWTRPFTPRREFVGRVRSLDESDVVWLTEREGLAAVEAKTGRVLWQGAYSGAPLPDRVSLGFRHALLEEHGPAVLERTGGGNPPHFICRHLRSTYVRQPALAPTRDESERDATTSLAVAGRDPRVLGDAWRRWGVDRPPPRPASRPDPWLARSLPWSDGWSMPAWDEYLNRPLAVLPLRYVLPIVRRTLLSIALVLAPLAMLAVVVRRRRFSLRVLLAAPLLAGAMLTIGSWSMSSSQRESWFDRKFQAVLSEQSPRLVYFTLSRWEVAVLYAPPVAGVAMWLAALARRRWKRVVAGAVALLLGMLIIGSVTIARDLAARPLRDGEYYWWPDAPSLFWPGLLFTSWVVAPMIGLVAAVRWFSRPPSASDEGGKGDAVT